MPIAASTGLTHSTVSPPRPRSPSLPMAEVQVPASRISVAYLPRCRHERLLGRWCVGRHVGRGGAHRTVLRPEVLRHMGHTGPEEHGAATAWPWLRCRNLPTPSLTTEYRHQTPSDNKRITVYSAVARPHSGSQHQCPSLSPQQPRTPPPVALPTGERGVERSDAQGGRPLPRTAGTSRNRKRLETKQAVLDKTDVAPSHQHRTQGQRRSAPAATRDLVSGRRPPHAPPYPRRARAVDRNA